MMEFWGLEVKSGGSVKVHPGDHRVLHLSQACLGEVKKDRGNECIRLFAEKDGKKFVIGILSPEKFPHITIDLVFEDDFELSHDGKQGSVHFAGYKVEDGSESLDEDESSDDLDELVPIDALNNGQPEAKESKPAAKTNAGQSAEGKSKVKIVEPNKDAKSEDDDDSDDDDFEDEDEEDESDEEVEDEDLKGAEGGSDEEDDSDEDEESEEETPVKKPESSKKRPGESTSRTPVPEKKAKFSTPEKKADGKKVSGHVATPHPAKQAAKTPANAGKSNKQSPKSGGSVACTSCSRSFGSQQALESHSKAKHGGK